MRARRLHKAFGRVIALDGVDLDIPCGQVHGLVGPNGAGKSTLLSLLLGTAVADSGRLQVLGSEVRRTRGLPEGVAGFVDGPAVYPGLTARQNLAAVARLRRLDQELVEQALDQVGLTDVAGDRVRGFSLGMRQRLGLAAALLTSPRLLVLDEPSNGLDPAGTRHVLATLACLAAQGCTVVLSSHRMEEVAALCSEVTLLREGRVVFTGPVTKLAAEAGPVDHLLRTSDPDAAWRTASALPLTAVLPAPADPDALIVRGAVDVLDELVARLVGRGVAVRELTPVLRPLEAAFQALTGSAA